MDIKQELDIGLKEIRNELSESDFTNVILTHSDGSIYQIKDAIVFGLSREQDSTYYFYTNSIQINILQSSLLALNAPISGYTKASYQFNEYNIVESGYSTWDTVLHMSGTLID